MRKKVLVVLYNINKAQEHEWFVKFMDRVKFDIEFVLINGSGGFMHRFLNEEKIPVHLFSYRSKKNLPFLVVKLFRLMKGNKYDIVHAHLFEGTLTGILAAYLAHVPARILTRHYSDFHHEYNPSVVRYDRWINSMATTIIAISENVKQILVSREGVLEKKIKLVHHGIDFSDYAPGIVSPTRIQSMKKKYNLEDAFPVIGVISKFIEWKGIQYTIPAFDAIRKQYPNAVLLLVNAHGPFEMNVLGLLSNIDSRNYRLIEFENDIPALYKIFDCFVHVPVTSSAEAFGQVYIESLASMIPSVFTLSGIASEFIRNGENAVVVPFRDVNAIEEAILLIMKTPDLRKRLTQQGYLDVKEEFDVVVKFRKLEKIYLEATGG